MKVSVTSVAGQRCTFKVECSVAVMLAMFATRGKVYDRSWMNENRDRQIYMFDSGAKLTWRGGSDWWITSYAYDDRDGHAAVHELKIMWHMVQIKKHYAELNKDISSEFVSQVELHKRYVVNNDRYPFLQ